MVFLLSSALLGCNAFEDSLIERTCTELRTCDLYSGLSVLMTGADGWQVVVLDADKNERFRVSGEAQGAVAAAFNPINRQVTVVADFENDIKLKQFTDANVEQVRLDDLEATPSAVVQNAGEIFLLFPEANPAWIQRLDMSERHTVEITNDFEDVRLLSRGPEDSLYLVDWKEAGGDLWQVDVTNLDNPKVYSLFPEYDRQEGRSTGLTTGVYAEGDPGESLEGEAGPHTCSTGGVFYSVAELSRAHSVDEVPKNSIISVSELDDVVGCAYDPILEDLVLLSETEGILWLDNDGTISEIQTFDGWQIVTGAAY